MRPLVAWASLTFSSLLAQGCGSSGTPPDAPGQTGASDPGASAETKNLAGARKRLQGQWEIVRYESTTIPKEAMPLMAELFDALRIRFEGSNAIVQRGKAEERSSFDVAEEQGDEFRLIANGGMFDGSKCRFLTDDEWEAADQGKAWPGVTRLKRAH